MANKTSFIGVGAMDGTLAARTVDRGVPILAYDTMNYIHYFTDLAGLPNYRPQQSK